MKINLAYGNRLPYLGCMKNKSYPKEVAQTVSLRRPDLARGDAIAVVLTQDPTLTADQVIEILDEAAEENKAANE